MPLSPHSGALGHESWPGVLQGHLLGTEVGWLVTKAECGGTRGGCLLKGSSLRTFFCLPRSALPPAHPRFTRTFMQVPLWGKAQPFGVTAIALWSFACLGRGASQAPMKKAWKWQVLQEFCSRSRWFGEDLATRAPAFWLQLGAWWAGPPGPTQCGC